MQASKHIIVDGKPALIGCTKGLLGVKGGTYYLTLETRPDGEKYVQAWYAARVIIEPEAKYVCLIWGQLEIGASELKPMQEYYNPVTGKCLFVEDKSQDGVEMISDKNSLQEVAPGVFWYSYDAFFDLNIDSAGNMLMGIGLEKFCEIHLKIGKVIKYTATGLELIQPLKFNLAYTARETEESQFRLSVQVVHGAGGYEYSTGSLPLTDPEAWQTDPDLIFANPENKKVYVRDSAGTVASLPVAPENWTVIATLPA